MKIVFTQVSDEYYAVFTNREHYTEMLGYIRWDAIDEEWQFSHMEGVYLSKEEFNLVNNFLRGLEDLQEESASDVVTLDL